MKRTLIVLLSTLLYTGASAQNMATIIREMPETIIPTLSKNNVLDFVDYHESKMKAVVTNELGYQSEMTVLTDDYSHIRTSSNSDIQIKLLPTGQDTKIISLIRTVTCDSINADSRIEFYTTKWEPLNASDHITLTSDEQFAHMSISATGTDITVTFRNPFLLDKDAKQKDPITLVWNGKEYTVKG